MPPQAFSDRLLTAMINADRTGVAGIIDLTLAAGIDSKSVISDILDPAIVRLGQL